MTLVAELRDVTVTLGGRVVLEDVCLDIRAGDYMAILGPNASGKTTLLKVLLGLIEPDRGTVRVLGGSPRRARQRIGYVPQHSRFDLSFPIRVEDVVLMGRLGQGHVGRPSRADRAAADEALARVEIEDIAHRPIGTLSGGQLQRVLIARALVRQPALLLLDEPTASLDERVGRNVWELFEELSHEMTVVVVTHDIGAISRWVRSVACLNRVLHYHPTPELTPEILEATYGCPVDLLAHGHPHRVLDTHDDGHGPGEGG